MGGLKDSARRLVQARGGAGDLTQEVAELRDRVTRLEQENVELRRQGLRVAELVDVVSELLVPLSQRRPEEAQEAIERFRRSL